MSMLPFKEPTNTTEVSYVWDILFPILPSSLLPIYFYNCTIIHCVCLYYSGCFSGVFCGLHSTFLFSPIYTLILHSIIVKTFNPNVDLENSTLSISKYRFNLSTNLPPHNLHFIIQVFALLIKRKIIYLIFFFVWFDY